jgi:hypothetical protein
MLVRPQYWGFFTFDLEHAFAFYWNMKACFLLSGVFLLLMLLTENDFGVSLLGAAWVYFSGFIQWWYSTPSMLPEMIGCVALLLVAAHYVILSPRLWVIAASAVVFSVCLMNCVLFLYPPFQVPLFYLGIAILVGSLGPRMAAGLTREHLAFRIGAAMAALFAVAAMLVLYYGDAKEAITLVRGTVYPGSRMVSGGGLTLARVFGGFYGFFMSERHFPAVWGNVCEASNFVLLFPVPVAALLWSAWRKTRVTALEWSLIAYLAVLLAWITMPWPHVLAVVSGFGLSPTFRSPVGLGLASIFLCCIFLAKRRVDLPEKRGPRLIIAASLFALLAAYSMDFAQETNHFAPRYQILLVCVGGATAGYSLLARRRIALATCILVPCILHYGLVNPIAIGLEPILRAKPVQQVSQIVEQDPDAGWAVYGSYALADMFKTAGAQVFNGTKLVPPLEALRVIDPELSGVEVYNRYAHISLAATQDSTATFQLVQADSYTITIDPSSDFWRRLRIRYVALPFAATNPEFLKKAALLLVLPEVKLWVYRYQWSTDYGTN